MSEHHRALSKVMAHALRHEPEYYGLEPDQNGWVQAETLVSAICKTGPRWENIAITDIEEMIASSDRQRYQVEGDKIRAIYGHTAKSINPQYTPTIPPSILYHGTTSRALKEIRDSGLKPMKRKYLHLSPDVETASTVALRRTNYPQIIKVDALKAYTEGIIFYSSPANIWLTSALGTQYLDFSDCH